VHLFDPLTLRGRTLRNRIAVSPMCQYSSEDGFATDWHLVHLGSRAVGGAGLVFTEATAVNPVGRISLEDLGLWKDAHVPKLRQIAGFVKEHGARVGVQLAHAGRKASTARPWDGGAWIPPGERGWQTVGPSAVPFDAEHGTPRALDEAGIQGVIDDFVAATARSLEAGFDVVEIHGAHGYLIHEFLSPLSNKREDRWGGSFAARCRLLETIVTRVRDAWPEERPLFVRVSASDWTDGGWTADDTVDLARRLKGLGVDLLDCSSAGNVPVRPPAGPGFQVPFAERVRRKAELASGAVGMITTPEQADAIVREGRADIVLLAREMLRDPYFPRRAAAALGHDIAAPPQYARAW